MNYCDAYVTEILSEPYTKYNKWWVNVRYTCEGWPGLTEIMCDTKEQADNIEIEHHFLC